MKTKKKFIKPLGRKIHLPDGVWTYRVSKGSRVVHIVDPKGEEKFEYFTYVVDSPRNNRKFPKMFFNQTARKPLASDDYYGEYEEDQLMTIITPDQIKRFIEEVIKRLK